ncbi:MAG: flagellar hook protein FlgE [Bacteriovoracaceae bacterium]|nr:flagellar hook protein FlgE [Bacteriovoracaceae bacterium]
MSILNSLNIGITGLKAQGGSMSVIGDNIANAGTFGFKSSRAQFQDLMARSMKGIEGGNQIGAGAKLSQVTPQFNQGAVNRTENVTDLAIEGNGFFVVDTPFGRSYTRDGSFNLDKEGKLVTSDGYNIMGFQVDEKGNMTNKLGEIKLGSTTIAARASEEVKLMVNLDSRSSVAPFDPNNPDKTSQFNTSVTVFDNVGTERVVHLFFEKKADNKWDYHAMVDGADAQGGQPGKLLEMAKGSLAFSDQGQLQQVDEGTNSFNFNKGAKQGQKIKFNFGKTLAEGGNGFEAATQFGSRSNVARHTQDGNSAGTMQSISFNDEGTLTGSYDNGVQRDLAQVSIGKFQNNEGLIKLGKNLFKETRKSGPVVVGAPGFDGRGKVLSKSIELSNVDIADEFISLMNAQRNFQANTRTISTSDQMLQEVLNIKRA